MFIDKLELCNFKRFENLNIEFKDRLTVIIGNNGSGKTSILEAAGIAVGTLFNSFDGIPVTGIKKTDAHYKYYDMGSVIDVQSQYPVEITATGKINQGTITWKRSLNSENGKTTIVDAKDIIKISEEYKSRLMDGDADLILPIVAYYGTGRLWDPHREKKSDVLKKNTRTNGYIDSIGGTANIKLMLKWFNKMAHYDKDHTDCSYEYLAVRRAMEKCLSSLAGVSETEVTYNLDTLEIDISYKDENGQKVRIPLIQLSDGYRCALSLIADIAYRMAILNPSLKGNVLAETNGIVFIDEVDLHLHPEWQQVILSNLMEIFPKVQFIITTHAPAVINSVHSENLVILEGNNAKSIANEIYGMDTNGVIKSIMGSTTRPKGIIKQFSLFYKALDSEDYNEAEKIMKNLEAEISDTDPELAACRVRLDLERIGFSE